MKDAPAKLWKRKQACSLRKLSSERSSFHKGVTENQQKPKPKFSFCKDCNFMSQIIENKRHVKKINVLQYEIKNSLLDQQFNQLCISEDSLK